MSILGGFLNRTRRTVAAVAAASVIALGHSIMHITRANAWRDDFNPLRRLTMRRVVGLLEEGERGAYADLQWTYRFIEKRDATLRGGKRSLLGWLEEKDWEIRIKPENLLPTGWTKAQAEAQQKTLREAYDRIDNLSEAIRHLGLAEFRGYAHLEKHYAHGGADDGGVTHLEPVEQWYLCRKGSTGLWLYNKDARPGITRGTPLITKHWIIREVEDPIDEIALIAFCRKGLSQKDWDGFIEAFGIPSLFLEMAGQAPPGKEKEYQETAEQIIGDSRGVLPPGSKLHAVEAGQRGVAPFEKHLDYQDKQIVLAITSGLLTMLAESGSGTLAGGAHSETFDRVGRALAKRVSETFQAQFDKEVLAEHHPDEPVLAWFEISANEEQDSGEFVKDVGTLSTAGYQVDADQVSEKTGLRVTLKSTTASPQPPAPVANRRVMNRAAELLGVPEGWVAPIEKLLVEMEAKLKDGNASDAEVREFLAETQRRLPELLGGKGTEELARVFEGAMGAGVVRGLEKEKGNK